MSRRFLTPFLLLLLFGQKAHAQWDTLDFQTPSTHLSAAGQFNNRLLAGYFTGLGYSDDFGAQWLPAQNGPRNAHSIWTRQDKVYAARVQNGKDSTWISDDGGQSFQFWGAVTSNSPASKVIRGDTMLFVGYEKVLRLLRGSESSEVLFTSPGFNYNLQIIEFGNRLVLLSTDGIRWSEDGGQNWQQSPFVIPINNQGIGYDRLLVHGNSIFYHNRVGNLLRSDDGGETWNTLPFFNGLFILTMLSEGDQLLITSRDQVGLIDNWRSADNGQNWTEVYPEIFTDEVIHKSYLTPAGKRLLTSAGCFALSEDETQWETRQYGLPKNTFSDALKTGGESWVVADLYRLYVTSDNGRTYRLIRTFESPYPSQMEEINGVILLDYGGYPGFARSDDGGTSWSFDTQSAPFVRKFCEFNAQQALVLAYSYAPFLYDLATEEFQAIPGDFQNRDQIVVFNGVIFSNDPDGYGVQASLDTGQTFVPVNTGLPDDFQCEALFVAGDRLFAKSPLYGMYVSSNLGGNWAFSPGPPDDLYIFPTRMAGVGEAVFTTNGARVFYSDDGGDQWFLSGVPPLGIFSNFIIGGVYYLRCFGDDVYMSFSVYTPGNSNAIAYIVRRKISELVLSKLKGRVFADSNNNQHMDAGEAGVPHVLVYTENDQNYGLSNADGFFKLLYESPDNLKPALPFDHFSASPVQYAVNQAADSLDFALYIEFDDVRLELVDVAAPRPGFPVYLVGFVQNASLQTADVTLKVGLDPRLEFLHAEPPAVVQNDTLVWNNLVIPPLAGAVVNITARLADTVSIGAVLQHIARASTTNWTDDFPENNADTLLQTVAGSFDPNDKTALRGDTVPLAEIQAEKRLDYHIRFQNTGNYPAEFVRIVDTLETDFNPLTFRLDAASHPLNVRFAAPRVLEFFFDHIHLPDSISDEAGSHGFVRYSVVAQPDLVVGDSLLNRAAIYFDYNAPVITNTAVTVVDDISGTADLAGNTLNFSLSPNPAPAGSPVAVNLVSELAGLQKTILTVFDVQGKRIREQTLAPGMKSVSIQGLDTGNYVIQIVSGAFHGVSILVVK